MPARTVGDAAEPGEELCRVKIAKGVSGTVAVKKIDSITFFYFKIRESKIAVKALFLKKHFIGS